MRTRIKICGITRPEDALAAVAAGADALGLVFYPPSPRAVSLDQAEDILRVLPALVSTVGLFVDPETAQVEQTLDRLPLQFLQFHGDEAADFCSSFGHPWIKALRVREGDSLQATASEYPGAAGMLLDSFDATAPGGTGKTFDWELIPAALRQRIILAGGLNPENVATAVTRVGPMAVDVSSGVESAPGIKSAERMNAFVREVIAADHRVGVNTNE